MNHTSDQHPWFQEARRPGSAKRDWYVWSDTDQRYLDARVIFVDTEASNWTWDPEAQAFYWHRFFSHQPDLNYANPEVQEAMLDRKSTRLNSSHVRISYAVFCLKKKNNRTVRYSKPKKKK